MIQFILIIIICLIKSQSNQWISQHRIWTIIPYKITNPLLIVCVSKFGNQLLANDVKPGDECRLQHDIPLVEYIVIDRGVDQGGEYSAHQELEVGRAQLLVVGLNLDWVVRHEVEQHDEHLLQTIRGGVQWVLRCDYRK